MCLVSVADSIKDILITPLGSRVMRPEYGSRLFELIDRRVNDEFRADLACYVIEAIEKWEKRVSVEEVRLVNFENNRLKIELVLEDESIKMEVAL